MRCSYHSPKQADCKARIIVDSRTSSTLLSGIPTHNHEERPAEIATHKAIAKLKEAVTGGTRTPTRKAVAMSVSGLEEDALSKLPKLTSLSRMARRARQADKNHPPKPTSLESLVIPPNFMKTFNGDSLLLWDSEYQTMTRRSLLLGTPKNMEILAQSKNWVIDGTFKSSPELFYQMVGIHGLFTVPGSADRHHIPLCYGLLPGKTTNLYETLFEVNSLKFVCNCLYGE